MYFQEEFTTEEKDILLNHFSNIDKPVFCLINTSVPFDTANLGISLAVKSATPFPKIDAEWVPQAFRKSKVNKNVKIFFINGFIHHV